MNQKQFKDWDKLSFLQKIKIVMDAECMDFAKIESIIAIVENYNREQVAKFSKI